MAKVAARKHKAAKPRKASRSSKSKNRPSALVWISSLFAVILGVFSLR